MKLCGGLPFALFLTIHHPYFINIMKYLRNDCLNKGILGIIHQERVDRVNPYRRRNDNGLDGYHVPQ